MDERTVLPGQTTHDMLFNYAVLKRGFVAGVCATFSPLTSHFSRLRRSRSLRSCAFQQLKQLTIG